MRSLPELTIAILGVGLIVGAVLWRQRMRKKVRIRVLMGLTNPDWNIRRNTIDVVGAHGIANVAGPLLNLLRTETDEVVLAALADAVARNQWEPADSEDLIELRVWAAAREQRLAKNAGEDDEGDTASQVPPVEDHTKPEPAPVVDHPPASTGEPVEVPVHAAAPQPQPESKSKRKQKRQESQSEEPDKTSKRAKDARGAAEPALAVVGVSGSEAPSVYGTSDLSQVAPAVAEILGGDLHSMELIGLSGEVVGRWESGDADGAGASEEASSDT
jgi:outer membrane biosynthesis protein TonB